MNIPSKIWLVLTSFFTKKVLLTLLIIIVIIVGTIIGFNWYKQQQQDDFTTNVVKGIKQRQENMANSEESVEGYDISDDSYNPENIKARAMDFPDYANSDLNENSTEDEIEDLMKAWIYENRKKSHITEKQEQKRSESEKKEEGQKDEYDIIEIISLTGQWSAKDEDPGATYKLVSIQQKHADPHVIINEQGVSLGGISSGIISYTEIYKEENMEYKARYSGQYLYDHLMNVIVLHEKGIGEGIAYDEDEFGQKEVIPFTVRIYSNGQGEGNKSITAIKGEYKTKEYYNTIKYGTRIVRGGSNFIATR